MQTCTRSEFIAEAMTWIDTPYRHQGRLKGVSVDCIGLCIGVAHACGISEFDFTHYDRRPDGSMKTHMDREVTPISFARALPADLLLFQFANCPMHVGILADDMMLIHAYAPNRKVVMHRLDTRFLGLLTCAYQIPGVI